MRSGGLSNMAASSKDSVLDVCEPKQQQSPQPQSSLRDTVTSDTLRPPENAPRGGSSLASETVTITDNRTGKTYELPVSEGTIKAIDLRKIKTSEDDFGLMTYDPAFMNTAACRSSITF